MLREIPSAEFVRERRGLRRAVVLRAGRRTLTAPIGVRRWRALAERQREQPVELLDEGAARWWWFAGRIYRADGVLEAADVLALAHEREQRAERRLQRAHAALRGTAGRAPAGVVRPSLTRALRREVWERCEGRCQDCGARELLEFDHVIPLALGGSSGAANLQLLCADCNASKGASI